MDTDSDPAGREAAVVFELLEGGEDLTKIVRNENLAPERVEELANQYARLDDLVIRSSEEISKIREEQFEKGYEEGYEEAEKEFGEGLI